MKNLLILGMLILFASGCQKSDPPPAQTPTPTPTPTTTTTPTPDVIAPVINLNGNTNDTMPLNSSYSDPGATAMDNVDGNISSSIVVSGTINKDLVGEYRLYYNVKDAAGNNAATATRYVYVANDADYLDGTYDVTTNCGATGTSSTTANVISSTTVNNEVLIGVPGNVSTIPGVFTISGNSMNAPLKTNGSSSFQSTGTIAQNKLSFSITFTAVSGNSTHGTNYCSANYIKK